jgi:carboxymethylenebutenolidase
MKGLLLTAALVAAVQAQPPPNAQEVSFSGSGRTLHGFVYRPKGPGPFPAVLWNHGSEKLPGWQPDLAAFYNGRGFVFFIPHRHGHGRSPGDYIGDLQKRFEQAHPNDRAALWKEQVRLLEAYNADVGAALDWLKTQPYVDANRIVMSGVSYGGIQTLLAAEKGRGVRGFIPFAPAAMSWANLELRRRLEVAVRNAQAPLFPLAGSERLQHRSVGIAGPIYPREGKSEPGEALSRVRRDASARARGVRLP